MPNSLKIGVDGGGTKTTCLLVDETGALAGRHEAGGCNPSIEGHEGARARLRQALDILRGQSPGKIAGTLLCMAGAPEFWRETAAELAAAPGGEFGAVAALPDSLPVLEAATRGRPGLVLHAGTGSFVAARTAEGSDADLLKGSHYAGGLGWKLGDPASGYDVGRRALVRGLLELQGWADPSALGTLVRIHTRLADAEAITRHLYRGAVDGRNGQSASVAEIAGLAPAVLKAAEGGDRAAAEVVLASAGGLLDLAVAVAGRLYGSGGAIRAGLSGKILSYAFVREGLASRAPFPLFPVADSPEEGLRLLLARWRP